MFSIQNYLSFKYTNFTYKMNLVTFVTVLCVHFVRNNQNLYIICTIFSYIHIKDDRANDNVNVDVNVSVTNCLSKYTTTKPIIYDVSRLFRLLSNWFCLFCQITCIDAKLLIVISSNNIVINSTNNADSGKHTFYTYQLLDNVRAFYAF